MPGSPPVELSEAWLYQVAWRELGIPMHIAKRMPIGELERTLSILAISSREKAKKDD